jgi:hypothetical protein
MIPEDMGEAGRRAFVMASEHVERLPDPDRFADVVLRYARAIDMVEEVRAEWIAEGRPKLFTHSNGAVVPHPLVKLLADSEQAAARAGRALKLEPDAIKGPRGGSPMGRQSAPDKKLPPVIKLSSKRKSS